MALADARGRMAVDLTMPQIVVKGPIVYPAVKGLFFGASDNSCGYITKRSCEGMKFYRHSEPAEGLPEQDRDSSVCICGYQARLLGTAIFMRHGARTPKIPFAKQEYMRKPSADPTLLGVADSPEKSGSCTVGSFFNESALNVIGDCKDFEINRPCGGFTAGSDGADENSGDGGVASWPFSGPPGSLTIAGWRQALVTGLMLRQTVSRLPITSNEQIVADDTPQCEINRDELAFPDTSKYCSEEVFDGVRRNREKGSVSVMICSTESVRCIQTAHALLEGLSQPIVQRGCCINPLKHGELKAIGLDSSLENNFGVSDGIDANPCVECNRFVYVASTGSELSRALKTKSPVVKELKQRALQFSTRYHEACVRFEEQAKLLRNLTGWNDKGGLKVMKKFVSSYGAYLFHGIPLPEFCGEGALLSLEKNNALGDANVVTVCRTKESKEGKGDKRTPETVHGLKTCGVNQRGFSQLLDSVFEGADIVTRLQYTEDPEVGWRAGGTSLSEIVGRLERIARVHCSTHDSDNHASGRMKCFFSEDRQPISCDSVSIASKNVRTRRRSLSGESIGSNECDVHPDGLSVFITHQSALLALQAALGVTASNLHVPPFGCYIRADLFELQSSFDGKKYLSPAVIHNSEAYSVCNALCGRAFCCNLSQRSADEQCCVCSGSQAVLGSAKSADECSLDSSPTITSTSSSFTHRSEVIHNAVVGGIYEDILKSTMKSAVLSNKYMPCKFGGSRFSTKPLVHLTKLEPREKRRLYPNVIVRWTVNGELPLVLPQHLRATEKIFSRKYLMDSKDIKGNIPEPTCVDEKNRIAGCNDIRKSDANTMSPRILCSRISNYDIDLLPKDESGGRVDYISSEEYMYSNMVFLDDLVAFLDERYEKYGPPLVGKTDQPTRDE